MTPNQAALSLAKALEKPGADFDALVVATELRRLVEENEALRRGEFICQKCGLRKGADAAAGPAPF